MCRYFDERRLSERKSSRRRRRRRGGHIPEGTKRLPSNSLAEFVSRLPLAPRTRAIAFAPCRVSRLHFSSLQRASECVWGGCSPPPRILKKWKLSARPSISRRSFIWIDMETRVLSGLKWLKDWPRSVSEEAALAALYPAVVSVWLFAAVWKRKALVLRFSRSAQTFDALWKYATSIYQREVTAAEHRAQFIYLFFSLPVSASLSRQHVKRIIRNFLLRGCEM